MNYFDAQDLCKENGGHVMEITSAAEDAIITELLLGGSLNKFTRLPMSKNQNDIISWSILVSY